MTEVIVQTILFLALLIFLAILTPAALLLVPMNVQFQDQLCAFTVILRLLQQGSSNKDGEGGIRFVQAFVVLWGGAGIVTVNTQLLKGKV